MARLLILPLSVALLLLGAACSGNDDTTATATATPQPPTSQASATSVAPASASASSTATRPPSATATTPAEGPFQPATTVTTKGASGSGQAQLITVRVGKNTGYDRIVFEFQGPTLPGYEVKYVQSASQCGSGQPVTVGGTAKLQVDLRPAVAHDISGSTGVPTVLDLNGPAIVQAKPSCDFEGVVDWVVGATAARPYRVLELQSPTRLVVDLSTP